jgi:hypothetical protein
MALSHVKLSQWRYLMAYLKDSDGNTVGLIGHNKPENS